MTEEELEAELMGETNEAPTPSVEGNENVSQEAESAQENREEGASGIQPDSPEDAEVDNGGGNGGGNEAPENDAAPVEEPREDADTGEDQGSVSNAQEPMTQMMSAADQRHLQKAKDWVEKLNARLAEGIYVNHLGLMVISDSVGVASLEQTLNFLSESEINARNLDVILKVGMGKTLNQIAAIENKDVVEVASERGVCEGTGRGIDTVYDWCRVARELPEECFMFGLTMTHYVNAVRVSAPKDDKQRKEFCKRRLEILKDAAENKGTTSKDVQNRLIDTSRAITMKNKDKGDDVQPEATSSLWRNEIDLFRVLRELDTCPDLLNGTGITRADIVDGIEYRTNELINRNVITDSVETIIKSLSLTLGGHKEPIEAESEVVAEVDSSEAEDDKANSAAFKKSKAKADAAKKKAAKKKTAAKK